MEIRKKSEQPENFRYFENRLISSCSSTDVKSFYFGASVSYTYMHGSHSFGINSYTPFAVRNGPLFSKILLSVWKQLYFKMTGIRMKISRQTGPSGRVPQNRVWFFPNSEWSID